MCVRERGFGVCRVVCMCVCISLCVCAHVFVYQVGRVCGGVGEGWGIESQRVTFMDRERQGGREHTMRVLFR